MPIKPCAVCFKPVSVEAHEPGTSATLPRCAKHTDANVGSDKEAQASPTSGAFQEGRNEEDRSQEGAAPARVAE